MDSNISQLEEVPIEFFKSDQELLEHIISFNPIETKEFANLPHAIPVQSIEKNSGSKIESPLLDDDLFHSKNLYDIKITENMLSLFDNVIKNINERKSKETISHENNKRKAEVLESQTETDNIIGPKLKQFQISKASVKENLINIRHDIN